MPDKIISPRRKITGWVKNNKIKCIITWLLLVVYYFSLPRTLFNQPYSTVIESAEGDLLAAKIASDGQWRFPAQDSVPDKFKHCIVNFEDAHFYHHPGFNPAAMVQAVIQNRKAGKVVRGGSTLTQQVIRLSRNEKTRNYFEKMIELILATRLELRHSKEEILGLYAAHAPYGGNVVGLEMASWRYFNLQPHQLSWAETATLAVLPNAPSLIYPGKNQQKLLMKRNALLRKLYEKHVIDKMTYELAVLEELPQKPFDLPQTAPHLLQQVAKTNEGERIKTTVKSALQERLNQIASQYYNQYRQSEIYNVAIIVVDVETRNILGYVGNSPTDADHQKDVDIIMAPRSTGSILKPFLYASMLDSGELLPNTLVPDIPTQIAGYSPQNFDLTFDGAVPAHRALARSLNIPSVLMLKDHGVNRFYDLLQRFKLRDIKKHPNHYGLSLILGGAESNLYDLTKTYAGLTSTVNYFTSNSAKYRKNELTELNWFAESKIDFGADSYSKQILGAGSVWLTYNAMKEVNRPEGDEAWKFYDSSLEIAWKTGTSFGNRDGWAIGTNSRYVVGVWVGNASGEGRPSLTGVGSAAPILFDVFNLLPRKKWFATPFDDLEEVEVCEKSGHLATELCSKIKQWVPLNSKNTTPCHYHKLVHLDMSAQFQVNSDCQDIGQIQSRSWFVLPPVMALFYKSRHIDYVSLPPFREGCSGGTAVAMDFIYPKSDAKIYLTLNFNGIIQPIVVKAAHSQPNSKLFWYLNRKFLGTTQTFHEMSIEAKTGKYYLSVTDELGNEISRRIEIVRE
ncbi:MAG TPA: penicillin-binding protein 1C [Flavobacterium sp.]